MTKAPSLRVTGEAMELPSRYGPQCSVGEDALDDVSWSSIARQGARSAAVSDACPVDTTVMH